MRTPTQRLLLSATAIALLGPCALGAQQLTDKLSVHGYLTQGYAVSDSAETIGIPKHGTTDYRRAALLFRYAIAPTDAFVIQLANRRLGQSATMQFEPDVKLDWAFYQHRFSTGTQIEVGRMPTPLGIYNETRYVGTMLPFYRAPISVYGEGQYTSESMDGLIVRQRLFDDTPLPLELSAYYGDSQYLEFGTVYGGATPHYVGSRVQQNDFLGTQIWVGLPIDGVRVGGGANRQTTVGSIYAPDASYGQRSWHASLDAKHDRYLLRGEYRRWAAPASADFHMCAEYVQAGVNLTDKLALVGQMESQDMDVTMVVDFRTYRKALTTVKLQRDGAVGVDYAFTPQLMWKAEAHRANGFNVDGVTNDLGPSIHNKYVITSLSVAF